MMQSFREQAEIHQRRADVRRAVELRARVWEKAKQVTSPSESPCLSDRGP
jgi:hypothetical protein